MALLELEDVVAGYGSGPDVLTGVDLEVEAGRTYCVVGPNGAGKSTLLKAVAGLLPLRAGAVRYRGGTLDGLRPDEILATGICFVPQDRALFPDMTVGENLRMGAFLEPDRAVVEQRLEDVFELFPALADRTRDRAGTLSGGQQQMVTLGRSLMLEPDVLMIDEPSLGLAPALAEEIFQTIERLSTMDITVLLVEQNVRRGLAAADRAVVLHLGRVVLQGGADEVLDDDRLRELYLGGARTGSSADRRDAPRSGAVSGEQGEG